MIVDQRALMIVDQMVEQTAPVPDNAAVQAKRAIQYVYE